mgnify:CR=1 FL=1
MAQEVPHLRRDVVREQHADVTVRQHDVVVETGNHGLAHRDGTVIFLVEMREELPGTQASCPGDGTERASAISRSAATAGFRQFVQRVPSDQWTQHG